MEWKNAGGTSGGFGSFLLGVGLMGLGGALLLRNIVVTSSFGWGMSLYQLPIAGSPGVPAGAFLLTSLAGIVGIFFNGKSYWGWGLFLASLIAMVGGVILNLHLQFRPMSLLDLLLIFLPLGAGIGLFLKSLRAH